MNAIRNWGLRVIAGLLVVFAVLAAISVAETGRVHLRAARRSVQYSGLAAIAVPVLLFGCAVLLAIASSPRPSTSARLRVLASAFLVWVGLFVMGYAFGAA